MRLLFLSDNFPPETNAPAVRTYEHCRKWAQLGIDVTILTCVPNFPKGKVYQGYRNKLHQKAFIDGMKVIRVWSYITANAGFLRRIIDYISFALTSFFAGLFIRTDIIVATSPQFFTTFSGYLLAKIKRVPWVFELRDLWPESIKTVGAMKESLMIRILERIELFLYRDAELVVALTQAFKENLVRRGIKDKKIRVISNGSDLDKFYPRKKDRALITEMGLEGKFVVGYIGTHGMAHGLEFIIRALSKIKGDDIVFLFIGDGAKKNDIVRLAQELGIKNAMFKDPIAKDEVPSYLSIIDAALVPLIKSDTFKTVLPSKIFEAAAMQKPILLGVEGEAKELVSKYGAGLCFEPENEEDFMEKINLMRYKNVIFKEMQDGCLKLAKDFDRNILAGNMLDFLKEAVQEETLRGS